MRTSGADSRWESWVAPLVGFVMLSTWEALARHGLLSPLFFPPPSAVAATLWRLLLDGELLIHLRDSLSRLVVGLFLGGTSAFLLGLLMGWSERLRRMVDPFVAAAHPVPKISILPLILIVFGIGETSRYVVVALAAFFPILINTMAGVREISPVHFQVARNYGAGSWQVVTRVLVPGCLPFALAGLRLALNSALVLTIAAELLTAQTGLGSMIWLAWETLRTEELYAGIAMTATLGIGFSLLIQWLRRVLVPWQVESR